ncbi:hypothetical protein [Rhodococcus erythropolis]|jgi:hypothetical protein|uniref:hypothetical protein n=1 Tax=Rhodococcus erythropolis TaxID=1833 RepID=UPI003013C81F
MDAHDLVLVGLISLALGAVSGFALLMAVDSPGKLRAVGIIVPGRIRQVHMDWIIMGVVMAVVGLAVPELSTWTVSLVMFGGIVNPATFIPMAFSKTVVTTKWFQTISYISFTSLSLGLILVVIEYLMAG